MIYIRGNRADYDGWAAGGADGWSYDEVLPYFKRSEDNERGEDAFHGAGGPLSVSDSRADEPAGRHDDRGEPARPATSPTPTSTAPARRASAASSSRSATACAARPRTRSCTRPQARPNLDVDHRRDGAADPVRRRARGRASRSSRGGTVEEIRAEREVILSAGAYQSPVLLMLSGIGPAEDLELFGIEVREDLPVGQNLQDHCMAQLNYQTDEPVAVRGGHAGEHRAARDRGPRAADLQHPRGGRRSSARGRSSTRRTSSSTSRRRCSSTRA